MNDILLADLSRALEARQRDRAGEYLRVVERALRPIDTTALTASGRPPRDAFARVGFVLDLMNRVESRLPGGARCLWVGDCEQRDGARARVRLVQRVFPDRDREKHNGLIAALRVVVVESFPDRAAAFSSELMPPLERYFLAGGVPTQSVLAEAGELAGFVVRLASSLETRNSLVAAWSLDCVKSTWTVRAEISDTPRPPPPVPIFNALTGRTVS